MKPSIAPANGEVVETTTRRRVLSPTEVQTEQSSDFWEYVATVRDWDNPNARHIVYIAREEPSAMDGKAQTFAKCGPYLMCPDGQQIAIADQEEIEIAFLKHCGGKKYRFFIKKGPQIVARSYMYIDAPPKSLAAWAGTTQTAASSSGNQPLMMPSPNTYGSSDPTAVVAGRAFDAMNLQERTAAEIGFAAMRTGLDAVTRAVDIQNRPQASGDLAAILAEIRAQNRGMALPEILGAITSVVAILKELGILGSNGNPMADKIITTAIDRFMNPPATGAPTNTTAEIVRQAPGLISGFAEVLREQRLLAEASNRNVAIQHTIPPSAGPAPQVIPPAPPAVAPNGDGAPSMDFVEKRIMQILQQPVSAEQAADDALAFLDGLDPKAVEDLAKLGETGLVGFFQARPNLKPATANMPRLLEFIRAFIRMHAEDVASAAAAAAAAVAPAQQAKPN